MTFYKLLQFEEYLRLCTGFALIAIDVVLLAWITYWGLKARQESRFFIFKFKVVALEYYYNIYKDFTQRHLLMEPAAPPTSRFTDFLPENAPWKIGKPKLRNFLSEEDLTELCDGVLKFHIGGFVCENPEIKYILPVDGKMRTYAYQKTGNDGRPWKKEEFEEGSLLRLNMEKFEVKMSELWSIL